MFRKIIGTFYFWRGESKLKSGRFGEAVSYYDKAIRYSDECYSLDGTYFKQRGIAKMKNGNCYEAFRDFNVALGREQYLFKRDLNSGMSLVFASDIYEAIVSDNRKIEDFNFGDNFYLHFTEVFYSSAKGWLTDKDFKNALEEVNRYIKTKPHRSEGFDLRGETYLRMKKFENAVEDFDKSLELKPDGFWTYQLRAIANRKLGRIAGSRADRRKALELESALSKDELKLEEFVDSSIYNNCSNFADSKLVRMIARP